MKMKKSEQWFLKSVECHEIYELSKDVFTIGRCVDADLSFDSLVISRQHSKIFVTQNSSLFIQDLKASNGVFVNGQRIPSMEMVEIFHGDTIFFGEKRPNLGFVVEKNSKPKEEIIEIDDSDMSVKSNSTSYEAQTYRAPTTINGLNVNNSKLPDSCNNSSSTFTISCEAKPQNKRKRISSEPTNHIQPKVQNTRSKTPSLDAYLNERQSKNASKSTSSFTSEESAYQLKSVNDTKIIISKLRTPSTPSSSKAESSRAKSSSVKNKHRYEDENDDSTKSKKGNGLEHHTNKLFKPTTKEYEPKSNQIKHNNNVFAHESRKASKTDDSKNRGKTDRSNITQQSNKVTSSTDEIEPNKSKRHRKSLNNPTEKQDKQDRILNTKTNSKSKIFHVTGDQQNDLIETNLNDRINHNSKSSNTAIDLNNKSVDHLKKGGNSKFRQSTSSTKPNHDKPETVNSKTSLNKSNDKNILDMSESKSICRQRSSCSSLQNPIKELTDDNNKSDCKVNHDKSLLDKLGSKYNLGRRSSSCESIRLIHNKSEDLLDKPGSKSNMRRRSISSKSTKLTDNKSDTVEHRSSDKKSNDDETLLNQSGSKSNVRRRRSSSSKSTKLTDNKSDTVEHRSSDKKSNDDETLLDQSVSKSNVRRRRSSSSKSTNLTDNKSETLEYNSSDKKSNDVENLLDRSGSKSSTKLANNKPETGEYTCSDKKSNDGESLLGKSGSKSNLRRRSSTSIRHNSTKVTDDNNKSETANNKQNVDGSSLDKTGSTPKFRRRSSSTAVRHSKSDNSNLNKSVSENSCKKSNHTDRTEDTTRYQDKRNSVITRSRSERSIADRAIEAKSLIKSTNHKDKLPVTILSNTLLLSPRLDSSPNRKSENANELSSKPPDTSKTSFSFSELDSVIVIHDNDDENDFECSQIYEMSKKMPASNVDIDERYVHIKNELAEMHYCSDIQVINNNPIDLDDDSQPFNSTQSVLEVLQGNEPEQNPKNPVDHFEKTFSEFDLINIEQFDDNPFESTQSVLDVLEGTDTENCKKDEHIVEHTLHPIKASTVTNNTLNPNKASLANAIETSPSVSNDKLKRQLPIIVDNDLTIKKPRVSLRLGGSDKDGGQTVDRRSRSQSGDRQTKKLKFDGNRVGAKICDTKSIKELLTKRNGTRSKTPVPIDKETRVNIKEERKKRLKELTNTSKSAQVEQVEAIEKPKTVPKVKNSKGRGSSLLENIERSMDKNFKPKKDPPRPPSRCSLRLSQKMLNAETPRETPSPEWIFLDV